MNQTLSMYSNICSTTVHHCMYSYATSTLGLITCTYNDLTATATSSVSFPFPFPVFYEV